MSIISVFSMVSKFGSILASVVLLAGCAIGNVHQYDLGAIKGLSPAGTKSVAIAVVDERPYVTNGDKTAGFVGLQRGGQSKH